MKEMNDLRLRWNPIRKGTKSGTILAKRILVVPLSVLILYQRNVFLVFSSALQRCTARTIITVLLLARTFFVIKNNDHHSSSWCVKKTLTAIKICSSVRFPLIQRQHLNDACRIRRENPSKPFVITVRSNATGNKNPLIHEGINFPIVNILIVRSFFIQDLTKI